MGEVNIRNLEDLIHKYSGPKNKVINTNVSKLTAPGENYMGIVLKVEATLKNKETGKEEEFNAVAKCMNFNVAGFLRQFLELQYFKEAGFYLEIVPTIQDFLRHEGVEENYDLFPKLYAARKNLQEDDNAEADADGVLLFENLNLQGYTNADRCIGFDMEGAKIILNDLALFHAAPLALKLKQPNVFQEKIKKYLSKPVFKEPPPAGPLSHFSEILEDYEVSKPYIKEFRKSVSNWTKIFAELMESPAREPFASIQHGDLWTNNTMQIFKDGKVTKSKIIDFQLYFYESPILDLLFFLCTSVQLSVFLENFDNLIKYYHDNFINYLEKLGCDTAPLDYSNFTRELDLVAPSAFFHIMFLLVPIFGKKGEAAFDPSEGRMVIKKENISQEARDRAAHILATFGKKGWIP